MSKITATSVLLSLLTLTHPVFASPFEHTTIERESFFTKFNPKNATLLLQAGGYTTTQGRNRQEIQVAGSLDDIYTVTHHYAQNTLVGLGYFINAYHSDELETLLGVNAFYFGHTTVTGTIIRELQTTPLGYSYSLQNYPIYLTARIVINPIDSYSFTFTAGIGPNIIKTSNFKERSLDGGITPPENFFSGQTKTAASAVLRFGFQFNNVLGNMPVEFSYQIFYLGQGQLENHNTQFSDPIHTGYNIANALMISVSI